MSELEQRQEQLPSERARQYARDARSRGDGEDAVRAAKVRRSAWALALLALAFYLGFIAWNVLRAPLGG
jgi:hypothetical protein